jgi:carbon monoxide dehydrogenase subunit G
MFTVTRSVSASRLIDVPVSQVLQALHDPPAIIQLNPLVIHYEASSSDPNFYTITDKLMVFGLWKTETKFNARFVTVDDGVDVSVAAGVGTKITNRWRVRNVENGTELLEEATLEVRL